MTQPCVVYVVDDDDLVRTGLSRLLRAGGFRTKAYETPELFLLEVISESPACILLDIAMPGISALRVQDQLKARGIRIPLIAVSVRDDDETRQRARDLEARFFLRKPVDDQALLDAIAWVTHAERIANSPDKATGRTDSGADRNPPASGYSEP